MRWPALAGSRHPPGLWCRQPTHLPKASGYTDASWTCQRQQMDIALPLAAEKKQAKKPDKNTEKAKKAFEKAKKAFEKGKKAEKCKNAEKGKKDLAAFDTIDDTIDELAASAAASPSMPPTPPSGNCLSAYSPRLLGMPIALPTKLPPCPAFPWDGLGSSWDGSGSCST